MESYLERQPALGDDSEGLLDLIYNEVVLREEAGDEPQLEEYLGRFPRFRDELRLQFQVHRASRRGYTPSNRIRGTCSPRRRAVPPDPSRRSR